jgi:hypothetical protein
MKRTCSCCGLERDPATLAGCNTTRKSASAGTALAGSLGARGCSTSRRPCQLGRCPKQFASTRPQASISSPMTAASRSSTTRARACSTSTSRRTSTRRTIHHHRRRRPLARTTVGGRASRHGDRRHAMGHARVHPHRSKRQPPSYRAHRLTAPATRQPQFDSRRGQVLPPSVVSRRTEARVLPSQYGSGPRMMPIVWWRLQPCSAEPWSRDANVG